MFQYRYTVPETRKVRYICHTDCYNEADDQYTLAHILMTPRLELKGIIGAHFDKNFKGYAPGTTAQASYDEIIKIMDLMHVSGEYPVFVGAGLPLADEQTPQDTPAARFIIEEAMKEDDKPLYIGLQGSLTDLASAILIEPEICHRMTAIWIGGGIYPKGGNEFNLMQDIAAANVLFKSDMPVWQIPMNIYKEFAVSLAELEYKVAPHGKIGAYLFDQMVALNNALGQMKFNWPHGELWGLGDEGVVAALMCEEQREDMYTTIKAPTFDPQTMEYIYDENTTREIRVYHKMDTRLDLEDLFCKLALNFPGQDD